MHKGEKIKPIDEENPDNLLILNVSFEKRCKNIVSNLDINNYKTERGLLVRYTGINEYNRRNQNQKYILDKLPHFVKDLDGVKLIRIDKYGVMSFWEFLSDWTKEMNDLKRITVDITTFTKQYLLMLLKFIKSKYPDSKIRLLYTPGIYPKNEKLSWGIKNITFMPFLGNIKSIESGKRILILLLGFEGNRAYSIWKYVNGEKTVGVIANPETYHGTAKIAIRANKKILNHPDTIQEVVKALDPDDTKKLLAKWYNKKEYKDYMFFISPLSTKMETVGVFQFFNEMKPDRAQMIYASPLMYNEKKYTLLGDGTDIKIIEYYL